MKRELKYLAFEIKAFDESGSFEGYANTFDLVDSYRDQVQRGAFKRTIESQKGKIRLLWQHDSREPIGVWDDMYEDDKGLYVKGHLVLETQRGREALALLKARAIDSMSIGFSVEKEETVGDSGIRKIKEVRLWEISLVTFPANSESEVTVVKSLFDDLETKDREKVITFINSLKTSSLPDAVDSEPVVQKTEGHHSEVEELDTKQTDDSESRELHHSLEQLRAAMTA